VFRTVVWLNDHAATVAARQMMSMQHLTAKGRVAHMQGRFEESDESPDSFPLGFLEARLFDLVGIKALHVSNRAFQLFLTRCEAKFA
jgi:hypothetical protein